MEGRKDVYKVTRARFDRLSKRRALTLEGMNEEEIKAALEGERVAKVEGVGKGKQSSNKKEEDEHVWIEGSQWRDLLPKDHESGLEGERRKESFLEAKARGKGEKVRMMENREKIGLRVVS